MEVNIDDDDDNNNTNYKLIKIKQTYVQKESMVVKVSEMRCCSFLCGSACRTSHLVPGVFDSQACSLCLPLSSHDESAVDGSGGFPVH